jgi:extracellular elastinolytic metalloproteinase
VRSGSSDVLQRPGKALTGPSAEVPAARAEDYVRAHRSALGLSAAEVDALGPPQRTDGPGGLRQVRWAPAYRGIPAFGSGLKVNLAADGRVLNVVGGQDRPLRVPTVVPRLSASDALRRAGASRVTVARGPAGPRRDTRFVGGDRARLVLFDDGTTVRLAWRVLYAASDAAVYDTVLDAATGQLLHRANLVRTDARALVWDQFPGATNGGAALDLDLSPAFLAPDATHLENAAIHAFAHTDDTGHGEPIPAGEEIGRANDGSFRYPFTEFTPGVNDCSASAKCSWDPGTAGSWQTNRKQNAVQAFYLANRFLRKYRTLDPDFQTRDQLQLRTDDDAENIARSHDNANMTTYPEGRSSIMRMYLWGVSSDFRAVNGGDDAAILYHEYAHEVTDRAVADFEGFSSLNGVQAGAMAEGFSDWYAKSFLVDAGLQTDTATAGEVDMGAYTDRVHFDSDRSIRSEALDCPANTPGAGCPRGGYTYGDVGNVYAFGPEVHADGEIWAQTLWDLRRALEPAHPGWAEEIVTAGLDLSPEAPSFLDMRGAILQAAATLHPSVVDTIWQVFAARGMGYFASTVDGDDAAPVEDFNLPPPGDPHGTVAGTVVDGDSGLPVQGATVAVTGMGQGPGALSGTTDAAGRYSFAAPVHTYAHLLISAGPGYDSIATGAVDVRNGATTLLSGTLHRNWSLAAGGATIADTNNHDGDQYDCAAGRAIDGSTAMGWSAGFPAGATPPYVTVQLPAALDVTRVEIVSAQLCDDDLASAVRDYRLEAASGDGIFHTVLQGSLGLGVNSIRLSDAGRLAAASAQKIRITLLSPQSRAGSGAQWVDLAELRVFGAPPGVLPLPTQTVTPVPTATPAPTVTPPPPPAVPRFSIRRTGRRVATFTVTCHAACAVTGTLTIDKKTAKRLHLGSTRTIGTLKARLAKAGKKTLTVHLTRRAAKALGHVKSITAKLKTSARYGKAKPVAVTRTVRITR